MLGTIELTDKEYDEYEQFKLIKSMETYAFEFWKKLGSESFKYSGEINEKILPLRFKTVSLQEYLEDSLATCNSRLLPDGRMIVLLTIKLHKGSSENILKMHIRHELIHFALILLDLKSHDHVAIFKILCDRYDAGFYRGLEGIEIKIYESCFDDISKMFEYVDIYKDNIINTDVYKVIKVIGDINIKTEEDVKLMKNIIAVIVDEIELYIQQKYGAGDAEL